jgi:lipopolysaccharide biosynthesis glycosyltransferase
MSSIEISPSRFANVPKNNGSWTDIVYYRLVASEFLLDCDRVIYSDVDVFFKKDMYSASALTGYKNFSKLFMPEIDYIHD